MKLRIFNLFALAVICMTSWAQRVDPLLAGAVASQTTTISSSLNNINREQKTIASIQALTTSTLSAIKDIEDKTYSYLSTVQGVVGNLHDIKRCTELAVSIKKNISACTKATINHPQGAIITPLMNNTYQDVYLEAASLASIITGLVTKGGKQNLLNSAERVKILSNVTSRLSTINYNLSRMKYHIHLYRWSDLTSHINPKSYEDLIGADFALRSTKLNIQDLKTAFFK